MYLKDRVLAEHSRKNAIAITHWIGTDNDRMKQLIGLILYDEPRVVQCAAYPLGIIGSKHPSLVEPYLQQLLTRMQQEGVHLALKRNVLGVLQHVALPEVLHAEAMNICFEVAANVQEAIAIRANALSVLGNLACIYPEIKNELHTIVHHIMSNNPTPGMRSRCTKVLKQTAHEKK